MRSWFSRWVMIMTVDSVWMSGEQPSVVAWNMDHLGMVARDVTKVIIIPCIGLALFKVFVRVNGEYILRNENIETRWLVRGLRTTPSLAWCEK